MIPSHLNYHQERADQDMEIELIRIAAECAIRERERLANPANLQENKDGE